MKMLLVIIVPKIVPWIVLSGCSYYGFFLCMWVEHGVNPYIKRLHIREALYIKKSLNNY